jgi:hypothetical protein
MVMKTEDIVKKLGRLEMKGGMHQIPEALLAELIAELKSHMAAKATTKPKPVKRSPGGQRLADDGTPEFKGKLPE